MTIVFAKCLMLISYKSNKLINEEDKRLRRGGNPRRPNQHQLLLKILPEKARARLKFGKAQGKDQPQPGHPRLDRAQ